MRQHALKHKLERVRPISEIMTRLQRVDDLNDLFWKVHVNADVTLGLTLLALLPRPQAHCLAAINISVDGYRGHEPRPVKRTTEFGA